ncbi:hypothetical protein MBLNU457_3227t2 [Dothideomycetes sp. NU457]
MSFDTTIPVFLVAAIQETVSQYISTANAATADCEYADPMGTLMHTTDIAALRPQTQAPVDPALLTHLPFLGWNPGQIISFAHEHLDGSFFSSTNMVILDERTNRDMTCLVLSQNELNDNDPRDYIQVRSDFESSITSLMTIEMACGGSDMLDTYYEGSDGVLRISVRDKKRQIADPSCRQ